ncbi:MAG: Ig-like domain-containing protein [Thermoanaerobaculia bacterium]
MTRCDAPCVLVATPQNVAVSLDVTANDSIVAPALVSQILVVVPPANGKAAPIGINTGVVTYTPALNFFGTDTFQYAILDTTGAISNLATVTVTVTFTAPAPSPPKALAPVRGSRGLRLFRLAVRVCPSRHRVIM